MCGIVGYIGRNNAVPVVIQGLQRLEYRGYDSCGIAMMSPTGIDVEKVTGRVGELQSILARQKNLQALPLVIPAGPHTVHPPSKMHILILARMAKLLWYTMELLKTIRF